MASTTLTEDAAAKFTPLIDAILLASDIKTVSVKSVRNALQLQLGYDLTVYKKSINALIIQRFDKSLADKESSNGDDEEEGEGYEDGEDGEEEEGEDEEEGGHASSASSAKPESSDADSDVAVHSVKDDSGAPAVPAPPKLKRSASSLDEDARLAAELHAQWNGGRASRQKKKPPTTTSSSGVKKTNRKKSAATVHNSDSDTPATITATTPKKKRKPNPNSPFNAPLVLSEPLSLFLGETRLSRPETVKRIWRYVKERNLQDPGDRRYILCDDGLRPVFGDRVHMFTLNKVLSQNMYKPEEKV